MPAFRVEPSVNPGGVVFGDPRGRRRELAWLGRLAEVGMGRVDVTLDLSAEHVVALVGKRGSGKSFTLGVLAEALGATQPQDLGGRLVPTHAVLLLDSLNIYWPTSIPVPEEPDPDLAPLVEQAAMLRRWQLSGADIRVSLWAPRGHVPPEVPDAQEFSFSAGEFESQDLADLFGFDLLRDPMGQALDEAWRKTVTEGWEEGNQHRAPLGKDSSLTDLAQCLAGDKELSQTYSRETLRAVRQRVKSASASGVFEAVGTPLSSLLEVGCVTIFLLGTVPDDLRRVVVAVLTRRLLQERSAASGAAKRAALGLSVASSPETEVPPTWLLIDEAQNLLPSERRTAATEALVRFVREGRNYGLSFGVATQQPTAVDKRIMAQVDTLIAHQLVTPMDVGVVADNLKCPAPRIIKYGHDKIRLQQAVSMLDAGQAMVSQPDLSRAVFVNIRPRVSLHGGFEL